MRKFIIVFLILPFLSNYFSRCVAQEKINIKGKSFVYNLGHPCSGSEGAAYISADYTINFQDTVFVKRYIQGLLGTWEDESGTKVTVTLKNNPDYKNAVLQPFVYKPFTEWYDNAIKSSELILYFEVEYLTGPYMNKIPPQFEGKVIQTYDKKNQNGKDVKWAKIADNANFAHFAIFMPLNDESFSGEWVPIVSLTNKDASCTYIIDFTNGWLSSARFFDKPTRLKKTSSQTPDDDKKTKVAIKASSSSREIKPDGVSVVEVFAQMYEFKDGDQTSSKPLANKRVEFSINSQQGIVPGSLSASSAITDANGIAKVKYTAPVSQMISNAKQPILTATITSKSIEHKVEDIAYINFIPDRGNIIAEPSGGIVSSHAIIPPDKRFPALIRAYIEDNNLEPIKNTELTFKITSNTNYGMLRDINGNKAKQLKVRTNAHGIAEINYVYDAASAPEKAVTETIIVTSEGMSFILKAEVTIGLNIVFESCESAYEGKGIVNAGETIPLRIKIKDAWHPELDLSGIINYWGYGGASGDTKMFVKLEIEKLGGVPDYLLDHLQIEKLIEKSFSENVQVRSFKEKKQINMLWAMESGLSTCKGYPCITPLNTGATYYELRLKITDSGGNEIYPLKHPASKAFLTINTGISAETFKIFVNLNPFGAQTKNAMILKEALSYKYGTLVSILDAFDCINRGDTEGLYKLLFSEIKGAILDKAKTHSKLSEELIETYTHIALAEKIHYDILQNKTGPLAEIDNAVFKQLMGVFGRASTQMVIITGHGNQKLFAEKGESVSDKDDINVVNKKNVKISISGVDTETVKTVKKITKAVSGDGAKEIPVQEKKFVYDETLKTTSYKNGGTSVYILPNNMLFKAENAIEVKQY